MNVPWTGRGLNLFKNIQIYIKKYLGMEAPLIKLKKTFLLQLIDLEPLFCHFYLFSTLLWPEMKILGTRRLNVFKYTKKYPEM